MSLGPGFKSPVTGDADHRQAPTVGALITMTHYDT